MTEDVVTFEVPKEINTRLDRLASLYGNLTAFVARGLVTIRRISQC